MKTWRFLEFYIYQKFLSKDESSVSIWFVYSYNLHLFL